jgi:tetratricopeptide (TPR) repeat protein
VDAEPDLQVADPAAAVVSPAVPPQQIPAGVAGAVQFTGRDAEIEALSGLMTATGYGDAVAVAVISGTAGVGKTALAEHWARQAAGQFPDGQLRVNLRGFDSSRAPLEPAAALGGFLEALGVAPERVPAGLPEQTELFGSLLTGKRVLILLDNALGEEQVRPLLPATPGCLAIITSRSDLPGLDGARLLTLGVLAEAEARELLADRLGSSRLIAEPAAASELTRLCAGLPLALVIAAAQANSRPGVTLAAVAAGLRDAARRLDALQAGELTASVRAVFSWSRENLTPAAASMFSLLGLHPGPDITAPAAASLADTEFARARELLDELARGHLLTEHVPGRYAFHDLLRAYAAEQAAGLAGADRSAALARLLDHYLHTAHPAALLLNSSREAVVLDPAVDGARPEHLADHQQARAWLQAERPVLLSAVTLAAGAGFDAHAWKLSWAISDFLDWRGDWLDWAAVNRIALAAATRLGDPAGQAVASRLLAHSYALAGDYDKARSYLTECLGLCRQSGDRVLEARVYLTLCWVAGIESRYVDTLAAAEQALAVFRAIGDPVGEAHALNNVGYAHLQLGDPRRARTFCEQAVALERANNHRGGEATSLDSLAGAEFQLGNYPEAIACYLESISLFRELGDRYQEAKALAGLGDCRSAAGDQEEAAGDWKAALTILEDLRHPDAGQVRRKLRQQ